LQATQKTGASDPRARSLSILTNRIYTNFYAAVDVVSWNTNQDCDEVIGILGRVDTIAKLQTGGPSCMTWDQRLHMKRSYLDDNAHTGPLGARDQMNLFSLFGIGGTMDLNAAWGQTFTTTITGFRWEPGHAYRMIMIATNNPSSSYETITGIIYDLNDLTQPLLVMSADSSRGGGNGIACPASGYVGVFAWKYQTPDVDTSVDATFDNFVVSDLIPTDLPAPAIAHPVPGAPQVVNRSPVSYGNFYPASSGITFNATTLTTTNTVNSGAIRLYLNGVDVSSGLSISGFATNLSVSYLGLASNAVYDARIELQDAIGRKTTNVFTFDTFSETYLASALAKNIECEDYDFQSGQFIDNPPASGYATNDTSQTSPINGSGVGYLDLHGIAGTDFFDYDSVSVHTYEKEFRFVDSMNDPVGTQQGDYADIFVSLTGSQLCDGPNCVPGVYGVRYFDTQRAKYSSLNPALEEYSVRRTEGGEWLNYTRIFSASNYYNVYLRAACGLAQPVRLDQIAIGPTINALGTFNVPSTFFLNHNRYTPLTDTNGHLAVVNLNGTNTVRLTIASIQSENTKQGLSMNYMAFVPALLLESAPVVTGPYTRETNASIDPGNRRISVPTNGSARFYRCRWDHAITITGVTVMGGNVLLTYQ
jgi:hypothetical protein